MNIRRVALVVVVIALVAGGVVVTRIVTRSNQEDVFLEGANSVGANAFTTVAAITGTTTTVASGGTTTTALFGGSGELTRCDPELLIAFLTDPSHRDKATAWIDALNGDPTLRWGPEHAKTKLTLADIPDYIHELTPTHLRADTRVTNFGFKNGKATPHQALLQKGMAVLADWQGMARVKCKCGNPLTPPHKVDHPHWVGTCWPGCHDRPPCSGNCVDTTTTEPTTTTTECAQRAATVNPCLPTTTVTRPPPSRTTTTPVTRPKNTTTLPITTPTTVVRTTLPRPSTTTIKPTTTTQQVPR